MVDCWYESFGEDEKEVPRLSHAAEQDRLRESILTGIMQTPLSATSRRMYTGKKPAIPAPIGRIAASLFLAGCLGYAYYQSHQEVANHRPSHPDITYTSTAAPTDKAVLQLADGREVNLDQINDGKVQLHDGFAIQLHQNSIDYIVANDHQHLSGRNTLLIPKGRQYQMTLPDGTRVWLNAASKLSYPVHFSAENRLVELSGEAYFEVSKDSSHPFTVVTESQRIDVLGTRFNVSSYIDDSGVTTTLVDGKVRVSKLKAGQATVSNILRPGQQVFTSREMDQINLTQVDAEDVVSWKDNLFVFNDEEISNVMKKISRWYQVDIEVHDGMAGKRIGGTVYKTANITELFDILKATGLLDYKQKGNKIIIMK